ncbi:hypothetical protein D3C85_604610 [compost metagenome]
MPGIREIKGTDDIDLDRDQCASLVIKEIVVGFYLPPLYFLMGYGCAQVIRERLAKLFQ